MNAEIEPRSKAEGRTDINIRSSTEFTSWVGRIASQQRQSVATLIEIALIEYATRIDFDEDPPIRLARDRRHATED